jgi:FkbM family methyltransferase
MTSPFRNVRLHWRRLRDLREITLDGVRVSTDPKLVPRSVRTALFKESYESHERRLVRDVLTPGDRVLEIGTGIGVVSLTCASICGPDRVLSYEANPLLEPIIRRNYALNGWTPMLRMRAVTTDGQPVALHRNDNIVSSSIAERAGFAEKILVASDPFDQVIAEHRPDAVIMDVEGAEIELLTASALRGVKHIIAEIHPHITGDDKVAQMLDAVRAKGFGLRSQAHKTVVLSVDRE